LILAVPREIATGERRVALVPPLAAKLVERGFDVRVEAGAGLQACFGDDAYQAAGVRIEPSAADLLGPADVVLKVQAPAERPEPQKHEVELMKEGSALVSFVYPLERLDVVRRLAERRITCFAMELMPRITRAQPMDALSAMSSVAGYKAVLIAAGHLPRFFPMLMTAAGTITPARVLVLGAGVAGLQAIATARRLGAVVEGFDIRPAVKEQVESIGARFVELEVQVPEAQDAGGYAREQPEEMQARIRALLEDRVKKADVVICTALVPGKRAPLLVTAGMVRGMRPGSVIVDLAAEQGGNCELTEAGSEVVKEGVMVSGLVNLPSLLAVHASEMYGRTLSAFLLHLVKDGRLDLRLEDELTRGPLVTHAGEVMHEATKTALEGATT
jgi:NAD(P) transhydrogenase subunit alpha